MPSMAVVGANWGDEGKGKITEHLAAEAQYVVRFQGGNNAGHTIMNDYGTFALHLLPSGVFYPHVTNVIGPGVALNIPAFLEEVETLVARGVPRPRLALSDRTQILLDAHIRLDTYEEERLGLRQFGSTRSGIAPFYADKFAKVGVQVADLFSPARLTERVEQFVVHKNIWLRHLYNKPELDPQVLLEELLAVAPRLAPYVTDTTALLHRGLRDGALVLLEGQLGALRDPDHGIYPFTTSSSTLAGYAAVGAGIPPGSLSRIVAVTKAYSSAVGAGPFVTELDGANASALRERGGHAGEYGATTGRPRRVGWFDAVATRYGALVQGATEVALTNLDVLGYLEEIPVAVAYRLPSGETVDRFPTTGELQGATPVLATFPGWTTDVSSARTYADLPPAARRYVEAIEDLVEVPVHLVSVGPRRDQVVWKP